MHQIEKKKKRRGEKEYKDGNITRGIRRIIEKRCAQTEDKTMEKILIKKEYMKEINNNTKSSEYKG